MNPEFSNALLVLAYLALGMIGIALLLSWALKRFGWPELPSSIMSAPEAHQHAGWLPVLHRNTAAYVMRHAPCPVLAART